MTFYEQDKEKAEVFKDVARLMDVAVQEGVDTFGRPYLWVDLAGLRRMHETAVRMGNHVVAEDIRQMLAHGQRKEKS